MCGRYNLITDAQAIIDHFQIEQSLVDMASWASRYNIAPGQDVLIIRSSHGRNELLPARWGLVPHWSKEARIKYSTINARAETVAEKPTFRTAFRRQRCLIPATGFYEWQRRGNQKIPCHICMPDKRLFAFAGLWDHWEGGGVSFDSCSIIVTTANDAIKAIHERMPVILDEMYYKVWMNPADARYAQLKPILAPYAGDLCLYPVSRRVNNPENDDVACIDRVSGQTA